MELQENLESCEKDGIHVFAISYDPVEVLEKFSDRFGIAYPLLSDVGSTVISRFGILNANIPEEHPWYGVPFPGAFMVDEKGVVIEKSFYANHTVRDSVGRMLSEGFHVRDLARKGIQKVETHALTATASLSSPTVRRGQVLAFALDIDIKKGYHIYSNTVSGDYIPTKLTFEPVEGVDFGMIAYPDARMVEIEALSEKLPVYDGRLLLRASVLNRRKEGFAVKATLEYQACDARECYLPDRIDFELPLDYLDHVQG